MVQFVAVDQAHMLRRYPSTRWQPWHWKMSHVAIMDEYWMTRKHKTFFMNIMSGSICLKSTPDFHIVDVMLQWATQQEGVWFQCILILCLGQVSVFFTPHSPMPYISCLTLHWPCDELGSMSPRLRPKTGSSNPATLSALLAVIENGWLE